MVFPFSTQASRHVLIDRTYAYAERESLAIGQFQSNIYLKFHMDTECHGALIRLIPFLPRLERGRHSYFGESAIRLGYTAPGILDKHEIAFYSTMPYMRNILDLIITHCQVSIYRPTLMQGRILSPFYKGGARYYKYQFLYYYDREGETVARFQIKPRISNTQLISGWMDILPETGQVVATHFNMYYDQIRVSADIHLGASGLASLLPQTMDFTMDFRLFRSRVTTRVSALCDYSSIRPYDKEKVDSLLNRHGHDLTYLNRMNADSTVTDHDLNYFEQYRPLRLTLQEDSLYRVCLREKSDPTRASASGGQEQMTLWYDRMEDIFLDDHHLHLGAQNFLRLPPLITPSMLQWSGSKGLSVKTRIRLNCQLPHYRTFYIGPSVGYNFKKREFYWKVPFEYLFAPRHSGMIALELGNGNRIYSSVQADEVRQQLSSRLDYDSLLATFRHYRFDYYNDFYTRFGLYYELTAGLMLHTSLVYHDRRLMNWNSLAGLTGLSRHYRSVAPNVHVDYTPGLYYYWKDHRRIKEFSRWPTFSLDYERAIRFRGCNSQYERWEMDSKYSLLFPGLRTLFLRGSYGCYTNRREVYFVDYSNFSYNSLPDTWQDEMMGQLQALDAHWYNESRYYVRFSACYQSPMMLLSSIPGLTTIVKTERIYCNVLQVHALSPYIETGYGFSTHLFDCGAFMGIANRQGVTFGWKFVLRFFEDE